MTTSPDKPHGPEFELAERVLRDWEAQPFDDESGFAEKVILARALLAQWERAEQLQDARSHVEQPGAHLSHDLTEALDLVKRLASVISATPEVTFMAWSSDPYKLVARAEAFLDKPRSVFAPSTGAGTSRDEIIEQCARVCDPSSKGPQGIIYATRHRLAADIRSLKNAAPQAEVGTGSSLSGRAHQNGEPVGAAPSSTRLTSAPGRIPDLEGARINAGYWLTAARSEDVPHSEALMALEQSANAWKNAAYAMADQRDAAVSATRRTEEQEAAGPLLTDEANFCSHCGDRAERILHGCSYMKCPLLVSPVDGGKAS